MTAALPPRDWRDSAACRDKELDLFFPVSADGPSLAQAAEARAVCSLCKVRPECLDFALRRREPGVWGGTTGDERDAARRALTRGTA